MVRIYYLWHAVAVFFGWQFSVQPPFAAIQSRPCNLSGHSKSHFEVFWSIASDLFFFKMWPCRCCSILIAFAVVIARACPTSPIRNTPSYTWHACMKNPQNGPASTQYAENFMWCSQKCIFLSFWTSIIRLFHRDFKDSAIRNTGDYMNAFVSVNIQPACFCECCLGNQRQPSNISIMRASE